MGYVNTLTPKAARARFSTMKAIVLERKIFHPISLQRMATFRQFWTTVSHPLLKADWHRILGQQVSKSGVVGIKLDCNRPRITKPTGNSNGIGNSQWRELAKG